MQCRMETLQEKSKKMKKIRCRAKNAEKSGAKSPETSSSALRTQAGHTAGQELHYKLHIVNPEDVADTAVEGFAAARHEINH